VDAGIVCEDRAADDVAMAADVFGRGMHGHVGTERERLLEIRRCEGVVDGDDDAPVAGTQRGDRRDVGEVEQRVGGVSIQIIRVFGRIAAFTAARSRMSTYVKSRP